MFHQHKELGSSSKGVVGRPPLGVQSRSVRESGKLIPHSGRHYGPDTSWQRHDHARRPSCDTAIEGSAQRACGTVWAEPQDSRQVAQTGLRQRRSHGPKAPRSTVLSPEEEAIVVAFRKHTLLPLDDCLYALQATIPNLTRSSLHRCLKRHGISRLPEIAGDKVSKKPFKRYPIGYFHIDIAEVRTGEGKLYLFVAIDRTSKFAFAQLHPTANVKTAVNFLAALIKAVPYRIHTVLTDNGIQFGDSIRPRSGPTARYRMHMFDRVCREHEIEHRFTKPNHPWTNGQVERMNRSLKEATIKRYHYETHRQLKEHLAAFLDAYNFAKRLKTLRGLTPYEAICKAWADKPDRFRCDPTHFTSGLNT